MDLVTTLKAQHRMLEEIVGRLDEHLGNGDAARVRVTLDELRQALRAHLDLEDAQLHLPLQASPLADGEAIDQARAFAKEIAAVAQSLKTLCEAYAQPGLELDGFREQWAQLAGALTERMHAEDTSLLPLYQRVVGKTGLLRRAVEHRSGVRGAA